MKKKIMTLAIAGAAISAMLAPAAAFAASDNQAEPGVPGERNCVGQTMAFVAQGAGGESDSTGIKAVAADEGLTVQEAKALIEAYCAGEFAP